MFANFLAMKTYSHPHYICIGAKYMPMLSQEVFQHLSSLFVHFRTIFVLIRTEKIFSIIIGRNASLRVFYRDGLLTFEKLQEIRNINALYISLVYVS